MKRGETWSTELAMGAFVECPLAGSHRVRVLYHDTIRIANEKTLAGLVYCGSEPFTLVVKKRPVRVTRRGRQIVVRAIDKLDPRQRRKVIIGEFGLGNEAFLPKTSAAGAIMARGWEAVPQLIDALDQLGRVAAQTLLGTSESLGRLRGQWFEVAGVATRVTYHPAALLRNASYKRPTWEDMQVVRDHLLRG